MYFFLLTFYTQLFYLMQKKENPEVHKKGQAEHIAFVVQVVFI